MKEYCESVHGKKAMEYFKKGYNCSQSLVISFAKECGLEESMLLRMSSSFGAGMGRMREVCGAVSGMFLVAGLIYGYDSPTDQEKKTEHYRRIQELAARFREENGSIVCRELLGFTGTEFSPVPEQRTKEYYQKRPCGQLVAMAATILEEYMEQNQIEL